MNHTMLAISGILGAPARLRMVERLDRLDEVIA
jgi:hypothetical protein